MSQAFQRYFSKIDWTKIFDDLISKCISLIFIFLLFFIAKKVIHSLVKRILTPSFKYTVQDEARKNTILRLVESLLNYCLYFILIYWILSILGLPVSSLLAGAGIAGVAIGMGAQGFLSDLVNGFFILLERQLDVGDNVRLTNGSINIAGIVSSVGIRTTQVRDFDGTLHFVPNRNITVVSNLSRGDMRVLIDIPLDANTDLEDLSGDCSGQSVSTRQTPRSVDRSYDFRPTDRKKWSLFLPYCDDCAKWHPDDGLSYLL